MKINKNAYWVFNANCATDSRFLIKNDVRSNNSKYTPRKLRCQKIGKWLESKRLEFGLSKLQVSKNIGISAGHYFYLYKDNGAPSPEMLKKIGIFFKTDLSHLIINDGELKKTSKSISA